MFDKLGTIDTKIEEAEDVMTNRECLHCGYCQSCLKCRECGETGIKLATENFCPNCHSKKLSKPYIMKLKVEGKKRVCPYCGGDNIVHIKTDSNKCPKCNSSDLTKQKKIKVKRLLLIKKKAIRDL